MKFIFFTAKKKLSSIRVCPEHQPEPMCQPQYPWHRRKVPSIEIVFYHFMGVENWLLRY